MWTQTAPKWCVRTTCVGNLIKVAFYLSSTIVYVKSVVSKLQLSNLGNTVPFNFFIIHADKKSGQWVHAF